MGIAKLLEQQTNSAKSWIPAGEIMGAVRVGGLRRDLPESFLCEVCNRWKMMMLSVVLSTGLLLTR